MHTTSDLAERHAEPLAIQVDVTRDLADYNAKAIRDLGKNTSNLAGLHTTNTNGICKPR